MIVVAIIAIIASIAIPNLQSAQVAANESSAIGLLKTLHTAESIFKTSVTQDTNANGVGEYGTFVSLTAPNPAFLDPTYADGTRTGYQFQLTIPGAVLQREVQWEASAAPLMWGATGRRTFYIDETGVIRAQDNGGALVLRAVGTTFQPI